MKYERISNPHPQKYPKQDQLNCIALWVFPGQVGMFIVLFCTHFFYFQNYVKNPREMLN
jgi:hypothetical protein